MKTFYKIILLNASYLCECFSIIYCIPFYSVPNLGRQKCAQIWDIVCYLMCSYIYIFFCLIFLHLTPKKCLQKYNFTILLYLQFEYFEEQFFNQKSTYNSDLKTNSFFFKNSTCKTLHVYFLSFSLLDFFFQAKYFFKQI